MGHKDQLPYIQKVPDYMKTPPMMVTVLDQNQKKIMEYDTLPGLELSRYACGPDTYTNIETTDKSMTVKVHSNATKRVIQIHIGVYRW